MHFGVDESQAHDLETYKEKYMRHAKRIFQEIESKRLDVGRTIHVRLRLTAVVLILSPTLQQFFGQR